MGARQLRKFTLEFRAAAVTLVLDTDQPVAREPPWLAWRLLTVATRVGQWESKGRLLSPTARSVPTGGEGQVGLAGAPAP